MHLSVCGATYLSINVGPQIVMGNRRLFSFVSGASNNCLLPRGRRFIVAEQTMCDYTYVLLNSKWTTWWLLCSCSLQSCVCTGRSDEMKRLAVVILLSSVSQSALSANARFFSPMTPMRLDYISDCCVWVISVWKIVVIISCSLWREKKSDWRS